jgi:hypothetical protein
MCSTSVLTFLSLPSFSIEKGPLPEGGGVASIVSILIEMMVIIA